MGILISISLAALVGFGTSAQDKATKATRPLKPFRPPVMLPLKSPLLMKDPGCAKDFLKSTHMEGLEQRKFFADLMEYGCGKVLDGLYYVTILEVQTIDKTAVDRVHLINMFRPDDVQDGWVPAFLVTSSTEFQSEEEMLRLLKTETDVFHTRK